jgi:UDP-N-acetyl-D-glucosamine dehydrogenase
MRESPAVEVMELLRAAGADVAYSDPHVPVFPKMREHHFDLASIALTPQAVASYDAVVLTTDHAKFDYEMVRAHAQVIIDSRGVYRTAADNIVKA